MITTTKGRILFMAYSSVAVWKFGMGPGEFRALMIGQAKAGVNEWGTTKTVVSDEWRVASKEKADPSLRSG
jgi:hypothetical protein